MQVTKKRKSLLLTDDQQKQLKKYVAKFPSVEAAAEGIGVPRHVLDRTLLKGTAAPENIEIIVSRLSAA